MHVYAELDSLSNLEELDMSFNEIENLLVPKGTVTIILINENKIFYRVFNYFFH